MIENICSIQQVFLRRFRDPIRVPRIRENYHRVPRIREIGSLQIHTGYLTFSLKKLIQWKYRANSVFRASASCSKILNDRKYIFNTVKISGRLCSLGQVQVAQKPWMIKNVCSIQWKLQGNSVSQGKRKLLKNPEW